MTDEVQGIGKRSEHKPKYPMAVTAASIMWIAFGCLLLLGVAFAMVAVVTFGAGDGPARLILVLLPVLISSGFAVAFIFVGVQTVRRKARGTIGNGIGSIALGVLLYYVPMLRPSDSDLGAASRGFPFLAVLLVAAGLLALVGRNGYKGWREAQKAQGATDTA